MFWRSSALHMIFIIEMPEMRLKHADGRARSLGEAGLVPAIHAFLFFLDVADAANTLPTTLPRHPAARCRCTVTAIAMAANMAAVATHEAESSGTPRRTSPSLPPGTKRLPSPITAPPKKHCTWLRNVGQVGLRTDSPDSSAHWIGSQAALVRPRSLRLAQPAKPPPQTMRQSNACTPNRVLRSLHRRSGLHLCLL